MTTQGKLLALDWAARGFQLFGIGAGLVAAGAFGVSLGGGGWWVCFGIAVAVSVGFTGMGRRLHRKKAQLFLLTRRAEMVKRLASVEKGSVGAMKACLDEIAEYGLAREAVAADLISEGFGSDDVAKVFGEASSDKKAV